MTRLSNSLLLSGAVALLIVLTIGAPAARPDYAVLRSGLRLHITGYERLGDSVRLAVTGGTVEIAASDLVAVEPEDTFSPLPAAPSTPFAQLIRKAAQEHGVDESLITRVIAVESNFNPKAVSSKRALGLMQLLPQTASRYDVGNVFDPAENIDAGTRYLKDLLERYRGSLPLALAAYNAGPEAVDRHGGVPPFPETQSYVKRITARLAEARNAQKGPASLIPRR
ncbi:MAG TPA: lytic transglycosylase domain-containing protein [Candidatus Polarisedimenticolia bacterium]|nr:lytic transglycosylase domain-containing protein [Candidatus Polarisedimenticolia bacterium]